MLGRLKSTTTTYKSVPAMSPAAAARSTAPSENAMPSTEIPNKPSEGYAREYALQLLGPSGHNGGIRPVLLTQPYFQALQPP